LLLQGKRLAIIAGNDGHGNFARFRQIGLPFLTMREHGGQIFGAARTGVMVEGTLTLQSLKTALHKGRSIVTTGPFLELWAEASGERVGIGGTAHGTTLHVLLRMKSTAEFGHLEQAAIWVGSKGGRKEQKVWQRSAFSAPYEERAELSLRVKPGNLYLRGELHTSGPRGVRSCYTNPIWLSPDQP
jgi:hypothetical protein